MKKKFWIMNAILSLLVFIWTFIAVEILNDGEVSMLGKFVQFSPFFMVLWSCLTLVRNKKKSNDTIIYGINYDTAGKTPQMLLRKADSTRILFVFIYTMSIGLSFISLRILNEDLRFLLSVGIIIIGSIYGLVELFKSAKKLGELDE